ncbi:putative RNA-directed DNA polymerase [Rosa chinensis]|uniref:Putative RNA-directed DNA polymerase n=1 Tax=Rosa chinensis TaxID=74649 RepID=A0A2P6RW88_ROSCH|nr:putative RNA-directed DNA polymerase [Rosa chinensis]
MVATAISLLANLSGIISVKLDDSNYPTWHFQMYSLLRGHGLLKFVDGTHPCPSQYSMSDDGHLSQNSPKEYEDWVAQDCNLISLITATLSSEALSHVVGCSTAFEVWFTLKDRYATVSRSNVVQLKSNLQSIEKDSDSIDKYLLRVKNARDQLSAIGVKIADEDVMILILKGLPSEFSIVRMMIKAKHAPISMTELRTLLLAAESEIECETKMQSLSLTSMNAMVAKHSSFAESNESKGLLPTPVGPNGFAAFHNGPRNGSNRGFSTNYGGHNGYNNRNVNSGGFRPNWNTSNAGFGLHDGSQNGYGTGGFGNTQFGFKQGCNNGYNGFRPRIVCQICETPGHSAQTCWHLGKINGSGTSSSVLECQLCGLASHSAVECNQRQSFASLQGQQTAMIASIQHDPTAPTHEV